VARHRLGAVALSGARVVHIVGIGLLVGSLVLVELRIWGRGAELPLARWRASALA
jgi:hypothetical protein